MLWSFQLQFLSYNSPIKTSDIFKRLLTRVLTIYIYTICGFCSYFCSLYIITLNLLRIHTSWQTFFEEILFWFSYRNEDFWWFPTFRQTNKCPNKSLIKITFSIFPALRQANIYCTRRSSSSLSRSSNRPFWRRGASGSYNISIHSLQSSR